VGHLHSKLIFVSENAKSRGYQPLPRKSLTCPVRCEQIGETCFYYGADLSALVKTLDVWPGLRYAYRPANLEDVFLKMTGRELRVG
jgi:hypothetical protein